MSSTPKYSPTSPTKDPPRILITGGGTGGHVYPAIAIADAVKRRRPDAVVAFAGSKDRIEWEVVPKAGYPIHSVAARGIQRRITMQNLKVPFAALKGVWQSWNLVDHFDADVAVGTGGFVAGPVIWAAYRRRRPILIQEQNAHVGITNRILSRFADRIHTAFRETLSTFPTEKTVVSGNPVRAELGQVSKEEARRFFQIESDQRVLLVLGGSGGSLAINETFSLQIKDFLHHQEAVVIWQTGPKYFQNIESTVSAHPRLKILQFIDRMDMAYAVCDLAICRSGAITCSELMATSTPSILVPSPNVAANHQTSNARSLESMAAAVVLPEPEMRSRLYDLWQELWNDPDRLADMSVAAHENATPDAADTIAADVLQLAERRIA